MTYNLLLQVLNHCKVSKIVFFLFEIWFFSNSQAFDTPIIYPDPTNVFSYFDKMRMELYSCWIWKKYFDANQDIWGVDEEPQKIKKKHKIAISEACRIGLVYIPSLIFYFLWSTTYILT